MMFWRQLPNLLTVLRVVLILPFALALLAGHARTALLLFVIAGVSDGIDGWLAKRYGWGSRFGAILDPLADKSLLLTGLALLTWNEVLPLWFLLLACLRDVVIVAGALQFHRRHGPYEMRPSHLSKLNTFLQILLVVSALAAPAGFGQLAPILLPLLLVTAMMTVLSGLHYVWVWGRLYRDFERRGASS